MNNSLCSAQLNQDTFFKELCSYFIGDRSPLAVSANLLNLLEGTTYQSFNEYIKFAENFTEVKGNIFNLISKYFGS